MPKQNSSQQLRTSPEVWRLTSVTRTKPATYNDVIKNAAGELRRAGLANPQSEARALVSAVTKLSRTELVLAAYQQLDNNLAREISHAVVRRKNKEPLSRIVGERDFFNRRFFIDETVLDPRPETETLILATLEIIETEGWADKAINILDVGTGSGCIITTLLAELPKARGVATDISETALSVAQKNAAHYGLSNRLTFLKGNLLEPVSGTFDLIVSNPPYIPTNDIEGLEPEVREYDPHLALNGGPDGLNVYREILKSILKVLNRGWLIVEVGAGQADDVKALFIDAVGPQARSWKDLNGHERCVAVRTQ